MVGLANFSYTSNSMTWPVFFITTAFWNEIALADTAQVTLPLFPSSRLKVTETSSFRRMGRPVVGLAGRFGIGSEAAVDISVEGVSGDESANQ